LRRERVNPQDRGHSHQGGHGFGAHLAGYPPTMRFDGSFRGSKLGGCLFVQETRGDEGEDLSLARCEQMVTALELDTFRPRRSARSLLLPLPSPVPR